MQIAPAGSAAANYAFDVTPARLVTGLITERGTCAASREGMLSLFPERRKRSGADESPWSDAEAEAFVAATPPRRRDDLALRVYTTRLLGGDPRLVLHGGGNTSVKTR